VTEVCLAVTLFQNKITASVKTWYCGILYCYHSGTFSSWCSSYPPLKGDTVYTLKINKVPLKSIGDNILHMPTFFV